MRPLRKPALPGPLPGLLLLLPLLLLSSSCSGGGTERIRNPRTGVETVRMKNNRVETPGTYALAFNLAVVREGQERGYAVYVTYHGDEPIQVPYASGIEVRVEEETWKLQGMARREISGVVGCSLGVPCSYVIHIVAPLDREILESILEAERFTVVVEARQGRYRGTGKAETIERMREFIRERGGFPASPG